MEQKNKIIFKYRKLLSILVGIFITGFWIIMMFFLFRDNILHNPASAPVELSPNELIVKWKDKEEWMRILLSGNNVGLYYMKIARDSKNSEYKVINKIRMEVSLIGRKIPISLDSFVFLRDDFVLNEFIVEIDALSNQINIHGLSQGTDLLLRWAYGGEEHFSRIHLDKQVSLYNAVIPILSTQKDLKVGKSFKVPAFDPIWESVGGDVYFHVKSKEDIIFNGRELSTYKVETTMGNMKTISYILPNGAILKQELPYGITLERLTKKPEYGIASQLKTEPNIRRLSRNEFLSRSVSIIQKTDSHSDINTSDTINMNILEIKFDDKNLTNKPTGLLQIFTSIFNQKK